MEQPNTEPTPEEVAAMFHEDGRRGAPNTPPVLPTKHGTLGKTTKLVVGVIVASILAVAVVNLHRFLTTKPATKTDELSGLTVQSLTTPDSQQVADGARPQVEKGNDLANRAKDHKTVDALTKSEQDAEGINASGMSPQQKQALGINSSGDDSSQVSNENMSRQAEAKNKREVDRQQAIDSSPVAVDYSGLFNADGSLRAQATGSTAGVRPEMTEDEARQKAQGMIEQNTSPEAKDAAKQLDTHNGGAKSTLPYEQPVQPKTTTGLQQDSVTLADGRTGYRLREGETLIEGVLKNRINGAFSGPVLVQVSANVYSNNRQHLIIPQGAVVVGNVTQVGSLNQERLFVAFHRIIMNNGESVSLDQFSGMNAAGETGVKDIVDRHYRQIFGASAVVAAIGAIQNIGNTTNVLNSSFSQQYRTAFAQQAGQAANQILARFINVLPTFIDREGSIIKLFFANDIVLPEYTRRVMP